MDGCREACNLTSYYSGLFQSLVSDLIADSSCCFSPQTRSFLSSNSHPVYALLTQQQVCSLLRLIGYENLRGICNDFCKKIREHMTSVEGAFCELRDSGLLSEEAQAQRNMLSSIWMDLYQMGITEYVLAILESCAQEACAQVSWSIIPFYWGLQKELEKKDIRTSEQESLLHCSHNLFLSSSDMSVLNLLSCHLCVDSCCDCFNDTLKSIPTLISPDEMVAYLTQTVQMPS